MRSDPRVALHHFLLAWALSDRNEWPPWAPPVRERESWQQGLTPAEIRAWTSALAVYDSARTRSLLFDAGLLALREWAAGAVPRERLAPPDRALADALETALPVYMRRWWPTHDERGRRWIAAVAPVLDEVEESVIPRLEAAYGGRLPDARIPVDVMVHVNDVGAYSAKGRIAISGWNRAIVMPHAVEAIFHEASHVASLEAPLTNNIADAFRQAGGQAPEGLWHDVIFFTTGEIHRMVLEARGQPGYRSYAEVAGIYTRGQEWATQLPALRRHWLPFLASGSSDATARQAALTAFARELLGR